MEMSSSLRRTDHEIRSCLEMEYIGPVHGYLDLPLTTYRPYWVDRRTIFFTTIESGGYPKSDVRRHFASLGSRLRHKPSA